MDSIQQKALQLSDAILHSQEFSQLKAAKKSISTNLRLKKQIEEFKQKERTAIQASTSSRDIEAKNRALQNELAVLYKIPEIGRYLEAEKNFNALLHKTLGIIKKSIDGAV